MAGYEYGNTRLRAMRSRLLAASDYSDMIGAGSIDRMLALLADTPYGPDVEAALVRTRGLRRLDEAVRSNLGRTLRQMASFYEEDEWTKVALLLERWDLRNLRALVRIPGTPAEPSDLSGLLVPAGLLSEAELAELAAQPDLGSRLDLMIAWGIPSPETAITLVRARADYRATGNTTDVEEALDHAFAASLEQVLDEEHTGAAAILRSEVDARNLGLAMRLRSARLRREPGWSEVEAEYVAGGLVRTDVWAQVAALDSAEGLGEFLTGTRLLTGWKAAIRAWVAHDDLGTLADQIQRAISSAAVSRFVSGDVLGFDVPLAFTFSKETEARNLLLISRGIVHRIPPAELEARLEVAA